MTDSTSEADDLEPEDLPDEDDGTVVEPEDAPAKMPEPIFGTQDAPDDFKA